MRWNQGIGDGEPPASLPVLARGHAQAGTGLLVGPTARSVPGIVGGPTDRMTLSEPGLHPVHPMGIGVGLGTQAYDPLEGALKMVGTHRRDPSQTLQGDIFARVLVQVFP